MVSLLLNVADIVRRGLIHVIVQPVGIEQLGSGAPAYQGRLCGLVVGEVVVRNIDVDALVYIPEVLIGQGVGIVFGVSGNKEAAVILALYCKDASLLRDSQQLQFRDSQNILQLVLDVYKRQALA